jgi:hypothetical protein
MADAQPVTYDFPPILQGSDWEPVLQFFQDKARTLPMDLTGYEIDMHVREAPAADIEPTIIVALSTRAVGEGAGRITVVANDPTQGKVQLRLTAAETEAIQWSGQARGVPAIMTFWYDLELVSGTGRVQRVMRGKWPFDAQITKQTL